MNSLVARHLKDFGSPAKTRKGDRNGVPDFSGAPEPDAPDMPVGTEPAPDIEAIRAAARDEGYQAAVAELRSAHDAALSDMQAAHEAALSALRQQLEIEVAETIGARFSALLADLGAQIGSEAARVLAPFVTAEVEKRLADRFAEELKAVLVAEGTVSVSLKGPESLFERVRAHPALSGMTLDRVESDDVDISAGIGARILSTRLAVFGETLAEVLP